MAHSPASPTGLRFGAQGVDERGPVGLGSEDRANQILLSLQNGINAGDEAGKGAEQTFELWVQDASTLNGVIRQIRKVKGVRSVERVRG